MAGGLEVDRGVGQRDRSVTAEPQLVGGDPKLISRRGQTSGVDGGVRSPAAGPGHGLLDRRKERLQACAIVENYFASEQVQALNAVGPFVNRVQSVVTIVLLDVVVAGVAVAAMNLDGQAVGLETPLGRPAFRNRGQYLQQQRGPADRVLIGSGLLVVN